MTPDAVPLQVIDVFVAQARTAGHPIVTAGPGPWPGQDYPLWAAASPDGGQAPNDLLDVAREAARARHPWVHTVLPTLTDAVRLAAAILPEARPGPGAPGRVPRHHRRPPAAGAASGAAGGDGRPGWLRLVRRPGGPGLPGTPRRVPFEQLVAEMPLTVRTLTVHTEGRAVHITEIPAAWLTRPLTEVTA